MTHSRLPTNQSSCMAQTDGLHRLAHHKDGETIHLISHKAKPLKLAQLTIRYSLSRRLWLLLRISSAKRSSLSRVVSST